MENNNIGIIPEEEATLSEAPVNFDSATLNFNLSKNMNPDLEAAALRVSRKRNLPVPLVREMDNREWETITVGELEEGTRKFLGDDVSNAAVTRDDIESVNEVVKLAGGADLPPEQRRESSIAGIKKNGYTPAQLAELKQAGFLPPADDPLGTKGVFNVPRFGGKAKWPILDTWYLTPTESDIVRAEGDKKVERASSKKPERYDGLRGAQVRPERYTDYIQRLDREILMMKLLYAHVGDDWQRLVDDDLKAKIDEIGKQYGMDTSDLSVKRFREAGVGLETDWTIPFDVYGILSAYEHRTELSTTELDAVHRDPDAHSAADRLELIRELERQAKELRGRTGWNETVEGTLTSIRFAAELGLTGGITGLTRAGVKEMFKEGWRKGLPKFLKALAKGELKRTPASLPRIGVEVADASQGEVTQILQNGEVLPGMTEVETSELATMFFNKVAEDYIERFSEGLGGAIPGGSAQGLVKLIPEKVRNAAFARFASRMIADASSSKAGRIARTVQDKTMFNGLIGEYTEEKWSDAIRSASTALAQALGTKAGDFGQTTVFGTPDEEIQLMRQLLLTSGVMASPNAVSVPGAVMRAARFSDTQRSIHTAVEATKTNQRSPETMERILRDYTGMDDTAYITAEDADTLFQSMPEVAAGIGLDADTIAEAERLGVRIPVSLAKVHTHTSGAEFDTVLSKLEPNAKYGMSMETASKIDLSDEAQKAAEQREKVAAETKAAYDDAIRQLTKLGRPESEVRAAAKLLSMAEYFAAHSNDNITAAEWIRNVAFKRMAETDWLADYNARRGLFQEYDREYEFPVITRPDGLELPAEVKAQIEREKAEVVAKYKGTPQWQKAPNGEPSNLSEDLWIAVRTPAFIRWFGDWQNSGGTSRGRQINEYGTSGFASLPTSTPTALHATGTEYSTTTVDSQVGILDKNGEPLVVWHITPSRFEAFRRSEQTGFHFGSEAQAYDRAMDYVDAGYSPDELGYYVGFTRINRPLYVPRDLGNWSGDEFAQQILSRRIEMPFELSESDTTDLTDITNAPADDSNGMMRNWLLEKGFDGVVYRNDHEGERDSVSYMVLTAEQFKAIDNLGTFSEAHNMYFQKVAGKHRGVTELAHPEDYNHRTFDETWEAAITLFEGAADASTLVHELGHYAFEMMGRLVETGMADQRMIDDFNKIMEWASKDTNDLTQIKENLAKGFEAFIMEGKAPTAELMGAFAKLRQLMLHIYKSVKALGVTLTDEVRTVFDGMLASDAALEQDSLLREAVAELNTGLLGLSQSETAVFRELMEKAGNQALQELAAEKAKRLAGLKKMWSVLADDEIAADRVYQVWQSAVDAGGIDYVAIEEIMGTKVADALRAKGLATKGGRLLKDGTRKGAAQGVHPAEFAAKAGYESVEEMLDELYFTKSPADFKKEFMALAEAQFHKDFAVSESVQSVQATLDTLDRFSDLLAVKGGVEGYRLRKNELIRRAKLRLEAMSVRQIMSDNQLIGDCRKGVRDMTKAVNEGDFITALETAQKLRENLEVIRRKADAKKAVERTIKTLSRARHAKKGSIYGDHQEALWDISQRFGFTRSQKQMNHTVASVMDEYNSEARENGDVELEVDRYFLYESHPYQAMQYGNFMQLSNLVDFIYGEGKDLVSAREATRKEKIAADVDRTIQESAHLPAKYTKDAPPVVKAYRTMAQWGTKLRNIIGMATNWNKESTLQRLYDEMTYAESLQLQLMSGVSLRVSEALSALHKSMSKLDLSVISDIRFPERVVRNGYKKWDAEKVAAVCLNLGTANNRQRLRDGFEWSDAELDRIAALLTAEDWRNIQRIWDAIGKGELFDAVRRTFKNENHFDLKEEDAVGFTVDTADGQTIDVAGGYYPLSYLYHKSAKQDVIDASKAPAEHRKASFTFERAAVVSDPVNLSLNILTTHIFDAAHYATHRETMRHVLSVIKNDNFRSNFEAKFGFERYQALKSLTENVAAPGATLKGVTEAWERRLRAIATASALWMNPSTMLMQLTSFTIGIDELGGYYWEAVAEQYTNYAELRNFVMNRSALMRSRANMMDMDIRRGTEPFSKGEGERAVEKVRDAGYAIMRLTDTIVATPVWYAAYNKAMAEGMDDSHAVAYADEFLAKTQGASRAIDMSLAQTTQVGRLFTVFYSAASAAGTMASKTVHRAVHGDISAAAVACNLLLPTALAALVRWAMSPGGDDDPDRAERALWRELIANPFQGIPGVRNLADFVGEMSADALAGGKPKHGGWRNIFEVIPFRGLNDIGGAIAGAVEDAFAGNEERALYRAADAVSMWYQLPVLRVYERAKRIINGHDWADLPDINDTVPKKRKRR